jgi:hypothetical protein
MGIYIKEILGMIKWKVKGGLFLLMGILLKDDLRMINLKVVVIKYY